MLVPDSVVILQLRKGGCVHASSRLNSMLCSAYSLQAEGISVSFLGSNFKVQAAGIQSMHASYEAELLEWLGGEWGSCRVVDMLFPSPNLVDLMHQSKNRGYRVATEQPTVYVVLSSMQHRRYFLEPRSTRAWLGSYY